MGKPKLTEEMVRQTVEMKSHGLNDCDIARAIGVCKQTFSKWVNHPRTKLQRELSEQHKKAESAYKEALLLRIWNAADKSQNWTAAAWLLERKFPDEYGRVDRRRDEPKQADVPRIDLGVELKVARSEDGDD